MEHKKSRSAETSKANPKVMQLANEIRAKANRMTDNQRMAAFDHGMKLIYGGSPGIAAKTGRS